MDNTPTFTIEHLFVEGRLLSVFGITRGNFSCWHQAYADIIVYTMHITERDHEMQSIIDSFISHTHNKFDKHDRLVFEDVIHEYNLNEQV